MLEAAKAYLEGKGYEIIFAQAPFVGGFKNREKTFRVLQTSKGGVVDKIPPLYEADFLEGNPGFRDALLNIIPKIPALVNPKSDPSAICCSTPGTQEHLNTIMKNAGGEATLFFIGHGVTVSTGKQFGQALASALTTSVLTLGTVTVAGGNVSFMDTYAALADNRTGKVLWSNFMRIKEDINTGALYEKSFFDGDMWPQNLLYHFPVGPK
jgi:hypothetical protein